MNNWQFWWWFKFRHLEPAIWVRFDLHSGGRNSKKMYLLANNLRILDFYFIYLIPLENDCLSQKITFQHCSVILKIIKNLTYILGASTKFCENFSKWKKWSIMKNFWNPKKPEIIRPWNFIQNIKLLSLTNCRDSRSKTNLTYILGAGPCIYTARTPKQ